MGSTLWETSEHGGHGWNWLLVNVVTEAAWSGATPVDQWAGYQGLGTIPFGGLKKE